MVLLRGFFHAREKRNFSNFRQLRDEIQRHRSPAR